MSDTLAGKIYSLDLNGSAEIVTQMNRPAGIGFLPDDTLLAVSMQDRAIVRMNAGSSTLYSDLSTCTTGEPNNLVLDTDGRAYVSVYSFRPPATRDTSAAALILVQPDGRPRTVAQALDFPCGSAFAADGRLILAETFAHRLTAFNVLEDGLLDRPRLFADLGDVAPDGLCRDAEGGYWIAASRSPHFLRVVEGGRVTDSVKIPCGQAVACALGGPEGQHLFCLTIGNDFEDVPGRAPTAEVYVVRVGNFVTQNAIGS